MDTPIRHAPSPTPATPAPAASGAPAKPKPINRRDEILFVGMNKDSVYEVTQLRKSSPAAVRAIFSAREQGKLTIRHEGKLVTCDLKTAAGAATFVASLKLPEAQSAKLQTLFTEFGKTPYYADGLDELAQIAQVWAKAELGGRMPSRMVLSGHNTGTGVYGDGNGKITFDMLERLADAMPEAARKVEDLHLSACYSGGETLMNRYQAIFPNAKTIWAYGDSAPGSYSGASAHLTRWERATRGSRADLSRDIAAHTRKGENVAVWTSQKGLQDGKPPETLESLKQRTESMSLTVARYFDGTNKVDNPGTGPLRHYYSTLHQILQSHDLSADERQAIEAKKDQTIRLLYFTKAVAPNFAKHHADAIKAGFESLGLAVPDFGKLSRAEALAKIAEFETALDKADQPSEAATALRHLLVDGLKDLQSNVIPDTWV